ncbi:MAG TPA: glucosidase [Acetobacteraceae bacterium]|nr:glucosidase [Acetobacteraceae bacterium]
MKATAEDQRLADSGNGGRPWLRWGPYLSERQWGTVREDYSAGGDAWDYFTHDQARSRAYRWGEDGLGGISDDRQILCFAIALWNGRDPIMKERLFGLTNSEGNHGEDVKEYYFYLDSTPTHSYMRFLYKYPQAAFPYDRLVQENRRRGRQDFEFELIDTGVFDEDRYFDIFVEYAKASAEDVLIRVTAHNRGPESASLHILPTLWFRNTWSWADGAPKPSLKAAASGATAIEATHQELGPKTLLCERNDLPVLFVENETNEERIFGRNGGARYAKDGINDFVVGGRHAAVNPGKTGTKAALHWQDTIPAGGQAELRLRLRDTGASDAPSGPEFDRVFAARRAEADEFYRAVAPVAFSEDEARVYRQALSGMLWSKQYYFYDIRQWMTERGSAPRNDDWSHMYNADIFSMPDKWEYPWYAAWDLAFHTLALGLVDPTFAKDQLTLTLRESYLHPNGQMPAYEWNFGDVNPPVHAWATAFLYQLDEAKRGGVGDHRWLAAQFNKLMLNFSWWINRKDRTGRNLFEGGFLGLDNIGVFDRSAPLPTGGYLEQADGTTWMAVFSQHMVGIAAVLAYQDPLYDDMVLRFASHFLSIGSAMVRHGDDSMWDEQDGFFYDVLRRPDGSAERLKVRSVVGLLPICAAAVFEPEFQEHLPKVSERVSHLLRSRPELRRFVHPLDKPGQRGRHLLSIVDEEKLRRILTVMLDEREFLGPHGIRSVSRRHATQPYVLHAGGREFRVDYRPAESDSGMFGGNSNWRGPVWMPVNAMLVRALLVHYTYYGNELRVECPTGSGRLMTLFEVAHEIGRRLAGTFLRDATGRRPVFGGSSRFQDDPHWRDCLLFYEYFHGDNGAGLGASHQTGWTGVIATLMHVFATVTPEALLAEGRFAAFSHLAQGGGRQSQPPATA